MLIQLSKC